MAAHLKTGVGQVLGDTNDPQVKEDWLKDKLNAACNIYCFTEDNFDVWQAFPILE